LVCAYVDGWHHIEERCQLGPHWTIPLVLTALPSFIRLVQCVRRWVDSKNYIHLVNVSLLCISGERGIDVRSYREENTQRVSSAMLHILRGVTMVCSLCFIFSLLLTARFYSGSNRDFRFGLWVLFATANSCYTTYWVRSLQASSYEHILITECRT
jgi:hypothetical protein